MKIDKEKTAYKIYSKESGKFYWSELVMIQYKEEMKVWIAETKEYINLKFNFQEERYENDLFYISDDVNRIYFNIISRKPK